MAFVKIETIKSDLMIRDIENLLALTDGITNNGSVYPMVDVWIDESTSLKYYICKTFALNNCSWNKLNKAGCVYGNKEKPIEIFGGKYQHILLTGNKDDPNNLYDTFGIGDFISDNYYICQDSKTSRPSDAITRKGTLSSSIDKGSQSSISGVIYCFRTHVKTPIQKLPLDATLSQITKFNKEMNDEISYQCSRLSQNLKSKGVEVGSDAKMSSLISKVGDIPLGKKWASGTHMSSGELKATGVTQSFNVTTNTTFNPSDIYLYFTTVRYNGTTPSSNSPYSVGCNRFIISSSKNNSEQTAFRANLNYLSDTHPIIIWISNVTSNGFSFNVKVLDIYSNNDYKFALFVAPITWEAFE